MPDSAKPRPSFAKVVLFAFVVGVAIGLVVFFLVAMPIYMIRSIDMAGDARTFVRNGILRVALPAGVLAAFVGAAVVGRWRWRGGHLAASSRADSFGVTGPDGR